VKHGEMSGSSELAEVNFEGKRGIRLLNFSSDYVCWITEPNGRILYEAPVHESAVRSPWFGRPIPSLLCKPPEPMTCLTYAFGRIWGAKGKEVRYSEPYAFSWFREENVKRFPEEIVGIFPVKEAIYVGSRKSTWVMIGTNPEKMIVQRVGNGMMPMDKPLYGEVQQSGREIPTWRHKTLCPVWLSEKGFVAGTQQARLVNLTEEILDIDLGSFGAGLFRMLNGKPQFIVTFPSRGRSKISGIFKARSIFVPSLQANLVCNVRVQDMMEVS